MRLNSSSRVALAALAVFGFCSTVQAAVVTINNPTRERWMYVHQSFPTENRPNPSVFGTTDGDNDFDERFAQFLLGFNTNNGGAGVPTGLGASSYQINSIVLEVTIQGGADDEGNPGVTSTFRYDPTQDSYTTYTSPTDADAGRPVELYGIGLRNGYTGLTLTGPNNSTPNWAFKSNFGPAGPDAAGVRSAYALGSNGSALVDVSNSVGANGLNAGFDPVALAIGQIAGQTPGTLVPDGKKMTFNLLASNPLYKAYLQSALNTGILGLAITSLESGVQGEAPTYPLFDSINTLGGVPAKLTIDYTIVPEPSSVVLAIVGLAAAVPLARRRLRRAA